MSEIANQIQIDFTQQNLGRIGFEGEMNRVELVFMLSDELAQCDYIHAEFYTADGVAHERTDFALDAENKTLTGKLDYALCVNGFIDIQLVGYVVAEDGENPQVIVKSDIVSAHISSSINAAGADQNGERKPIVEQIYFEVLELKTASHEHSNAKTLSLLKCPAVENNGIYSAEKDKDLQFNGNSLRLSGSGAVISGIAEIEKDGKQYFRLWLDWGNEPQLFDIKDYIDIPITELINVEDEDDSGLILNGGELDLGVDAYVPMPKIKRQAGAISAISANTYFDFGEVETLNIRLTVGDSSKLNEYIFAFVSGETPATLTLPSDITWGNDDELEIEANKRYEISIVENVALWVATSI